MQRLERFVVPLIWVFFVAEGIRGGITFPTLDIGGFDTTKSMSLGSKLILTFFPFLTFAILIPFALKYGHNPSWFIEFVNRLFSDGAYERMAKSLHFEKLVVIFANLAGLIGIIHCKLIDAPEINFYTCIFFLSGGMGFLVAVLIHNYF